MAFEPDGEALAADSADSADEAPDVEPEPPSPPPTGRPKLQRIK
jgi:hypothetical protein